LANDLNLYHFYLTSHVVMLFSHLLEFLLEIHLFQDDGRRSFWSVNGPRILQVGYEDEADPKVMEAYELIGSLV